jgi:hypothetical protein
VGGARAATPQLRLNLNVGRYLEVITDGGTHIRTSTAPGTVIPPGTYQAIISSEIGDAEDTHHMFRIAGPGQNLQTDLLGGDSPAELYTITLLPSSTYTFSDDKNPAMASVVFSTSAGGSAAGAGTTAGAASGASSGTTSNTPTSKSTAQNKDAVGSGILPRRGALAADVSTTGKLTLTFNGKAVGSLKAGRYTVAVLDETAKSAFTLQRRSKQPQTVSGKAFVGRRTVTVSLQKGQWFFYGTPGRKTYFFVVAAA